MAGAQEGGPRLGWGVGAGGAGGAEGDQGGEGPRIVRYDEQKVVEVEVRSGADLRVLWGLGADFWCEVRRGTNEVRLSAEALEPLRLSGIPHRVIVEDLQKVVEAERAQLAGGGAPGAGGAGRGGGGGGGCAGDQDWFAEYKPLGAISEKLDELVAARPDLASRFSIGLSLEGREIFGIRITSAHRGPGRGCKPALFLNATQHAREWIAPMTAMYVAEALVNGYGADPYITNLVDNVEFLIVPVANPDGYIYTWTTDRFWRKNRRPNAGGSFGVDLNRNWGHQWGVTLPHSSAGNATPTSGVYWGTEPFSEPETQRLRDYIASKINIRAHNDIHSYGQYILHPWGHTSAASPDHQTFVSMGAAMQQRIQAVHGRVYSPGTFYTRLYPASGVANDWIYQQHGILSFLFELRGDSFNPAPSHIRPGAEETLPAHLYKAEWILERYPFRADFDGNCHYSIDDFTAFINAWALEDPETDFDRSGHRNIDDFTAFMNAWAARR
jgi:hypothetical protein